MTARTNYILVDYENVQPADMALLSEGPFKVRVFLGPNQARIPIGLAAAMQALGSNAEYVVLETAGSNALDFHIAHYIGVLSSNEPKAFFHIISKDTGFDPLIRHLKGRKVFAQRSVRIADIPYFKPAALPGAPSQVDLAIAHLVRLKAAKPRAEKTLLNTLNALFRKDLNDEQLALLLSALRKQGVVKLDGTKVSYELPAVS